jgi:hypothetical protein
MGLQAFAYAGFHAYVQASPCTLLVVWVLQALCIAPYLKAMGAGMIPYRRTLATAGRCPE